MNQALFVFIVDDNLADVELTVAALAEQENAVRLQTCRGGACADTAQVLQEFEFLGDDLPSLIILDLQMPPQSGLDILTTLKAHPRYALIPVVVLSNSEEASDIQESYRRYAAAYMTKPVNFGELKAKMAELVKFWRQCRLPALPGAKRQYGFEK